jgi:hypothetical protein
MRLVPENQHEEELLSVATRHTRLINAFIHIVAGAALLGSLDELRWFLMEWTKSQGIQSTVVDATWCADRLVAE